MKVLRSQLARDSRNISGLKNRQGKWVNTWEEITTYPGLLYGVVQSKTQGLHYEDGILKLIKIIHIYILRPIWKLRFFAKISKV